MCLHFSKKKQLRIIILLIFYEKWRNSNFRMWDWGMNSFFFLQKNHLQDVQKLQKWKIQPYFSLMPSYFMVIQNFNRSILWIPVGAKPCKDICDTLVLTEIFWYNFSFTMLARALVLSSGGPGFKHNLLPFLIFLLTWEKQVLHEKEINLLLIHRAYIYWSLKLLRFFENLKPEEVWKNKVISF